MNLRKETPFDKCACACHGATAGWLDPTMPPEADFEAPSSDDVDELGRSRGIQVAPHTSSTSHGLRERGRGGSNTDKKTSNTKVVMVTPPVFATSQKAITLLFNRLFCTSLARVNRA